MLTTEILQTLSLPELKLVYMDALRDVGQSGVQLASKRIPRVNYLKKISMIIDRKRRS